MRLLKIFHFWVGLLGIIAFVLTGQYMMHELGQLQDMADGPRMLLRSGHIYILLTSLLNLLLASYMVPDQLRIPGWLQYLISVIIALSPFIMLLGFFNEYQMAELKRPYSLVMLYGLFGVAVTLGMAGLYAILKHIKSK